MDNRSVNMPRSNPQRDFISFHHFPLGGIDPMMAATGRSFPRHTHDQYGIGIVDRGGHSSWSGRGQVEAGPGTFICVNPAEVHDGQPVSGCPRSWRMLYFDAEVIETLVSDALDTSCAAFAFASPVFEDKLLRTLFNQAFMFATPGAAISGDTLACETAIMQLFAHLTTHSTFGKPAVEGATPNIRRARQRIDDDPAAALTLAELAAELGLSRFQLIRGFARELQLTPHAYVLQQRLALARRLMRAGHPLSEAACAAGFFDQSHLNRCFVRQFGVTPRRYQIRATLAACKPR